MPNLERRRDRMIENHLKARGIKDPVLGAMRQVPREAFVPEEMIEFAYEDSPLPIGEGQTISQPYIVAAMTQQLELSKGDRVLEIGTGSGYAAAILSRIAAEVFTIERHKRLIKAAEKRFRRLGYDNIHIRHGDGSLGWAEHAPYDAIVVTAGSPDVPQPLKDQLAVGGRMVIPIGSTRQRQKLLRVQRKSQNDYQQEDIIPVRFVPLVGAAGWKKRPQHL